LGIESCSPVHIRCYLIHCYKISLTVEFDDTIVDAIEDDHQVVSLKRSLHVPFRQVKGGKK
jgi:hypothetical protein